VKTANHQVTGRLLATLDPHGLRDDVRKLGKAARVAVDRDPDSFL